MSKKIVLLITIILLIFSFLISLDIIPYLRGPGPYPPNWQWPYQFTNTLNKIWLPVLVIVVILGVGWYLENKSEKKIEKTQWLILGGLVLLSLVFQLSVLYFSRAGIFVLLHRIINPDLNGYFTTALSITNVAEFLQTYNRKVLSFYMHAQGHMPGAILFFWVINKLAYYLPFLNDLISKFSPGHTDVRLIWNTLAPYQKTGAILSAILIPLLSSLSLIPLYFIAKHLYGIRTAIRSLLLYMVIPSVVLFIPISDVFFPIFFLIAFLFFLKKNYFLSGVIFSLGLFFSLSILPLLFIFGYFFINKPDKKNIINFLIGLVVLPIFLFLFFQFNMMAVAGTLMKGLPVNRAYAVWVFYNLYDFFIFTGIPISILFFTAIYKKPQALPMVFCYALFLRLQRRQLKRFIHDLKSWFSLSCNKRLKDPLLWGFVLMLLILNFSGSVRGETARIWLPFMSVTSLITAHFVTSQLKFSKNLFLYFILLQSMQILVMQEFWVMLW